MRADRTMPQLLSCLGLWGFGALGRDDRIGARCAFGDQLNVGGVYGVHPVGGTCATFSECFVAGDEAPHDSVCRRINVDEEINVPASLAPPWLDKNQAFAVIVGSVDQGKLIHLSVSAQM